MNSPFFDHKQLEVLITGLTPYIDKDNQQIILAILCAFIAHGGQRDKEGAPYLEHPLRVFKMMDTVDEKIVALLHDVFEDSRITEDNLRNMGFSEEIICAVRALTRGKIQRYNNYLTQVSKNSLALSVKKADIQDNLDPERLKKLDYRVQQRLTRKYRAALDFLNLISNENKEF